MMRGYIPHHGAVSPDCPVECLLTVLSGWSWSPLARAYDAPFAPPSTVGDVIGLYQRGQLRKIGGIGPRRLSEIEAGLVSAGLDLTTHRPAACADGTGQPRAGTLEPPIHEREKCPDLD